LIKYGENGQDLINVI